MQHKLQLPQIIAHRGASSSAPENTLAAMKGAHDLGATWVEFDVHLTKDFVPVVIHDDNVSKTTNGSGRLSEMLFSDLAGLDAGSWFSSAFKGERVPALGELLGCLVACGLCANIELKPEPGREARMVEAVFQVVSEVWPERAPALLFSSFSLEQMQAIRKRSDDVFMGFLMNVWDKEWQSIVADLSCVSVHANYRLLTQARVGSIKESGRKVLVYTVDDIHLADKLFGWGVDAIFTNVPSQLISHLTSTRDK